MNDSVRFLLLQVRNPQDPMRTQEVDCFARALQVARVQIQVFDLLAIGEHRPQFEAADVFLLGGSGDYSVTENGDWIERVLDCLRELHGRKKPTFASCWGFQAMARAMGGRVVKDLSRAEVGTHTLQLTKAGLDDPIFAPLNETFYGQMGHEDCVVELPADAVLLARSDRVANQAYRFIDRPIYCTQFHPELNRNDLIARVHAYPDYIERIAQVPLDEFCESVHDTPETERLLPRFVDWALDRRPETGG